MVIVGVLAGPSLSNCFNSDDGMGMCLRGKMVDAGILPKPAVAIAEPAAAPAAETPATVQPEVAVAKPEAVAAQPEVAVAEPELDVTPPAETPAPTAASDTLVAATFGLLRAEPDGSMVIAGSGTPGSEVEVYSNDQLLGKTKVEPSGDWVLVPDAPIPPGGTELTLAEAGKQGRAAESFVVVVSDDKKSEPLVVASTPGHASDILQGLERPAAGTATEVAAADPQTPAPTPNAPAPAEPVATATPSTEPAVAVPAAEPATGAAPAAVAAAPEAAPPAVTVPAASTPEVAATAPSAQTPAIAETPAVPAPPAATDKPQVAVATADPVVPAKTEPAVVLDNVPPTIDAIEIEGDRSFFAGGGPEGAVMRLYVDGKYIADATVADGRWLVEAGKVLTQPSQRIRIDMLKPGTAEVAARAEVDFKVEVPSDKPTAVAEAEPAKPVADKPVVVAPKPPATAEVAIPAVAPGVVDKPAPAQTAASTVTPPAAAEEKAGSTEVATAVKPVDEPVAPIVNATEPEAPAVAASATPQSEVTEPAPVETAKAETPAPAVPAAETAPATPAVEAAEAAPAEPAVTEDQVPTMVAVAVGDPEMARFASGKAIIRRGDNLWTIARRVYGAGIKYTTIYEANTGQIRNPDKIYPGQVFDLPGGAN